MKFNRSFFVTYVVPKVVLIPWVASWFLLSFLGLLQLFLLNKPNQNKKTKICIEAGEKGWEEIALQELYQSAIEYLGSENVEKLSIPKDKNYVKTVRDFINTHNITHYVYDPRTGDQRQIYGLFESFRISIILYWNNITPISILTDLSIRIWRAQSAILTAKKAWWYV